MSGGELLGHVASAGGTDDGGPRQGERVQDGGGVLRLLRLLRQGVAVPGFVRLTVPAQVRRVNAAAGEPGISRSKLRRDSPQA